MDKATLLSRIPVITNELIDMKRFAYQLADGLISTNPESSLLEAYNKSRQCLAEFKILDKDLITATYCGQRWCPICQCNRAAKILGGYESQLSRFEDLRLVTLTRPTVSANDLEEEIDLMEDLFHEIKMSKPFKKIKGLRKAELTTRGKGVFRYHYHVIMDGDTNANTLIEAWLKVSPESAPEEQKSVSVTIETLAPLFMYCSPVASKNENGDVVVMAFDDLDIINRVMKGRRMFLPFGGIRASSEGFTEEDLIAIFRREGTQTGENQAQTCSETEPTN